MVTCDLMLGEDPSTDPPADNGINECYQEALEYLIDDTLHEMIKSAKQSAGVLLVEAADEESE